ncbi:hypothetical protein ACHAQH_008251 [Verticillium albo-atrum]
MSLVIEVDDEMPGLKIVKWTNGDLDMLSSLASLRYVSGVEAHLMLYPTQVETVEPGNRVLFRGVWERSADDTLVQDGSIFLRGCTAWAAEDAIKYGNVGIDDFQFVKDGSRVVGVSPRVTRRTLEKVA